MDPDLLSDVFQDQSAPLIGDLLSNLPSRLTNAINHFSQDDSFHAAAKSDPNQAGAVVAKIEDIFESIAHAILKQEKQMVIKLKVRKKTGKQPFGALSSDLQNAADDDMRAIKFPSRNPQEAWKFVVLLRILELSHEALATGTIITKRDLYYRDPELFMTQTVVDRYVDDIAYTLGVERDALNVVAAAKGLIAGSFTITKQDNSQIDYRLERGGILVPSVKEISTLSLISVRWILVIEKEATFRSLSTSQYWKNSPTGNGIILTAKGYPDIHTRQLLSFLTYNNPHVPLFALVDYDPDGLGILSTYKHGSASLAHQANLAVPSIRWLGVKSSDIVSNSEGDKVGLLKLSARDRRIATKMLAREGWEENGKEWEWRVEMQRMLMLGTKAEIQILNQGEDGLEDWLDTRLRDAL
ncbi:Spo11/DNA topoisomerase VI subunit A [Bisporella sp. PMI_857]|nr:Spo11/DNA topoisomerase VI subunit A [Bisporella sp. PMI_857]